jgi:enoyl-[acyl-carrier protein] reductase III
VIDLENRVALVTGASRGIGRACALRLAQAGADVVVNYLASPQEAEGIAEEIRALGRDVALVKADMSEAEDIQSMMSFVASRFGRLDVLVSNVAGGGFHSLAKVRPEQFLSAMNLNTVALLSLVQAALPLMRGLPQRAKVVSLSSHGSFKALPHYGVIGASKAALESLSRHLALEFPEINFNVVLAGLVRTLSTERLPEELFSANEERLLTANRQLACEDIANAVLFLCSPLSDLIQGQVLTVDGGTSLR